MPDSTLVICQNALKAKQLQEYCASRLSTPLHSVCVSHDWFFQQWFSTTETSHQFLLHHTALTVLSFQQRTPLTTQLLNSPPLLTDFIRFVVLGYYSGIPWEKARTFFPSFKQESLEECIDIGKCLYDTLIQDHRLDLKQFYTLESHIPPCFNHIKQLFFIDNTPMHSWEKKVFDLGSKYWDMTFILPHSPPKPTLSWLESKVSSLNMDDSSSKSSKTPVQVFEHCEDECQEFLHVLHEYFHRGATTPLKVIYPSKGKTIDILKKALLKEGLSWTFVNPYKNEQSLLFRACIACLHFLQKSPTLASIDALTATPGCDHIQDPRQAGLAIAFDIYTLRHCNSRYSVFSKSKDIIDSIQELSDIFSKQSQHRKDSSMDSLLDTLATQKIATQQLVSYHQELISLSHEDDWLSCFCRFFNDMIRASLSAFIDEDSLDQQITPIIKTLKSFLVHYRSWRYQHGGRSLFYESCLHYLSYHSVPPAPSQAHVELLTLDEARYMSCSHVAILGCSQFLHRDDPHQNLFIHSKFEYACKSFPSHNLDQRVEDINRLYTEAEFMYVSMSTQVGSDTHVPLLGMAPTPVSQRVISQDTKVSKQVDKPSVSHSMSAILNACQQFSKRPLSATALDTYQGCPYKFFLNYVVGISPIESQQEQLSKSEWGMALHHILENVNTWISSHPEYTREMIRHQLQLSSEKVLAAYPSHSISWKAKKRMLFASGEEESMLDQITDIIMKSAYYKTPSIIEDALLVSLDKETVIKGKCDAVFDDPQGPVLVDYKTGKTLPTGREIDTLQSLQLPLYLYCLYKTQKKLPQGAVYIQCHSPTLVQEKVACCTAESKGEIFDVGRKRPVIYDASFFDKIHRHITALVHLIRQGQVEASMAENALISESKRAQYCSFCDYRPTCRYEKRYER